MIATMKVVAALCLVLLGTALAADKAPRAQLDEDFGYVEVRPGAHTFWVTYHVDQPGDWTEYPLIMWLQGGPGASGVGYGNFEELGPYYTNGSLRETAWTKKANVMFVDNPVGTGYSYVEDLSLLATTNMEIADDLVTMLTSVFADYPDMSTMPFFVYAESYGGKMTVDFALALDQAIKAGSIVCNFQGVALGDSWISPMDSVNTWGPFLYAMGFVNEQGEEKINDAAAATQEAVDAGNWVEATNLWGSAETAVLVQTNGVNFYNVLAKEDVYFAKQSAHSRDLSYMTPEVRNLYRRHVGGISTLDALDDLMNGQQADRWNIPSSVVWDSQGGYVFNTLAEDFMKPVVHSVVELLENTDVFVTVFSGDLDLICDTPGTYRWIENMEWSGKASFDASRRQNIHVTEYSSQAGYIQQDGNFAVFTILRSGHMVPIDAPEAALVMLDMITDFGASQKTAVNAKKVQGKVHKTLREEVTPKKETKVEEAPKVAAKAAPQIAKPAPQIAKPAPKPVVTKPVVAKVPVSAEVKAAHEPITNSRHSHVTPTGERLGKRNIISKKIQKKPTSPAGFDGVRPVMPVIQQH